MPRYKKTSIVSNDADYYEFLRKKRNVKRVIQFATPVLRNPTITDRASLSTTVHIWKYGDIYYNLASKYYGNVRYWWIIAWYNGYPTEAHIKPGDVLDIKINIEDILRKFGV